MFLQHHPVWNQQLLEKNTPTLYLQCINKKEERFSF